jgi:hypothetical protein
MLLSFISQSSASNTMSCKMMNGQQSQGLTKINHDEMDHSQYMSVSTDNSENMSQMMNPSSNDDCCDECNCFTTSCHQAAVLFEYSIKNQSFELEQVKRFSMLKPNSQFLSYLFKPPIFS